MRARSYILPLIALAAVVLAIDQLTKALIASRIASDGVATRVEIVGDWFALEYTENRGAAFGLFSGIAPILTGVSIAILAGVLWHYLRQTHPSLGQALATGAIVGGATGNLVDRIRLGHVIDFFSVGFWPNFNVADSAITLGALVLIWGVTRPPSRLGAGQPADQGT